MATPVRRQTAVVPPPRGLARPRRRDRWRAAARTAPGRLRLAALGLGVLILGLGALTGWQVTDRTDAADQVVTHSQPLSQNAAEIYRSLADADTTAAAGFLLAGNEPAALRQRYEDDLSHATQLLTQAAAQSTGSAQAQSLVSGLNQQLPVYAGLVETARADDRQGLPLGAAYLSYASQTMQQQLLPQAQKLSELELGRLAGDYGDARATPWAAYGLGVLVLAALVWVQWRLYRRTNRVFNPGLLGATGAVLVMLAWLGGAALAGDAALQRSVDRGTAPLKALNTARIDTLQARTAENLNLVARGSTTQYDQAWNQAQGSDTSALAQALKLAPAGAAGRVSDAQTSFKAWTDRHAAASAKNDAGDYQGALDATVGSGTDSAAPAFDATDRSLADAVATEQADFLSAARDGRDATAPVAAAAGVLALLGAAGALTGLGRRLAEYR